MLALPGIASANPPVPSSPYELYIPHGYDPLYGDPLHASPAPLRSSIVPRGMHPAAFDAWVSQLLYAADFADASHVYAGGSRVRPHYFGRPRLRHGEELLYGVPRGPSDIDHALWYRNMDSFGTHDLEGAASRLGQHIGIEMEMAPNYGTFQEHLDDALAGRASELGQTVPRTQVDPGSGRLISPERLIAEAVLAEAAANGHEQLWIRAQIHDRIGAHLGQHGVLVFRTNPGIEVLRQLEGLGIYKFVLPAGSGHTPFQAHRGTPIAGPVNQLPNPHIMPKSLPVIDAPAAARPPNGVHQQPSGRIPLPVIRRPGG